MLLFLICFVFLFSSKGRRESIDYQNLTSSGEALVAKGYFISDVRAMFTGPDSPHSVIVLGSWQENRNWILRLGTCNCGSKIRSLPFLTKTVDKTICNHNMLETTFN